MALRGLFIGVDRYRSADINWLSCARRDATALHALFFDTFGGTCELIVDEDASRERIEASFQGLAGCDESDVVVIAFSGHGTSTHELVVYDTYPANIRQSTISLEELSGWFRQIPADRLLLVLDCCFSGGMGSKVLQIDVQSRDMTSVAAKLEQLGGKGRIILTASGPTQEAYENPRIGHGFLTQELLTALQGPEELRQAQGVGIYRLLEWVTRRVSDKAREIGREQEPTVRGTFDGELVWPIFVPGERYRAAFPERVAAEAAADLQSLVAFGFPEEVISSWAGEIPNLNELQISAINDFGVLRGEHIVASAPTSSGKTMLGELAAIRGSLDRRRAIFLFPLKALVADKLRHFKRLYGPFGIRTIEATGETDDITPLLRGQYDIALLTYEKFTAVALTHPYLLDQVGTIVIDEVQMIADEGRGANLEFILTLLKMHRRRGLEPQLIALSAVIGDTNGLERWLGARLLRKLERPVPLDEGILLRDGTFRFIDGIDSTEKTENYIRPDYGEGKSRDWVIPTVRRLVREGKQVIVFRETTGETRHCAKYLADALGLPAAQTALQALPDGDVSQASGTLREVMQGGVAFHNSHLDSEEKRVVEEQFRARDTTLRVIAATTTLAMGVNTPASAVVIVGLQHPLDKPYSVAEYKNLVGRAGRLGYAEHGQSFLIAPEGRSAYEYWNHYVLGRPEDVTSRFLDADARTLILRVLVTAQRAGGMTGGEVVEFLEASLGAYQAGTNSNGWTWDTAALNHALGTLEQHKLIEKGDGERYRITELGRVAGESAIEVESVIRLVEALTGLNPQEITDPTIIAAAQVTQELGEVHFPINKRSTQAEPQAWSGELVRQGVARGVHNALHRYVSERYEGTLRAKRAVACLYYVAGTNMVEIERAITRFGGAFGGAAGPIRSVTSRTCDVVPAVARLSDLMYPGNDFAQRVGRLVIRLELGVPADAVDLARQCGKALSRGDYLRLTEEHLIAPEALLAASDDALLRCVGNERAKLELARIGAAAHIDLKKRELANIPVLAPYQA